MVKVLALFDFDLNRPKVKYLFVHSDLVRIQEYDSPMLTTMSAVLPGFLSNPLIVTTPMKGDRLLCRITMMPLCVCIFHS